VDLSKSFSHQPECGTAFTGINMATLKDGEIEWPTKELQILEASQGNGRQFCVIQFKHLGVMLRMPAGKVAYLDGVKSCTSPHLPPPGRHGRSGLQPGAWRSFQTEHGPENAVVVLVELGSAD
jgi:hypothetical protein